MWSFSVFAPTSLQYSSGPSVSSPHVAVAWILRPVARLKYGGVSSALHSAISRHRAKATPIAQNGVARSPIVLCVSALHTPFCTHTNAQKQWMSFIFGHFRFTLMYSTFLSWALFCFTFSILIYFFPEPIQPHWMARREQLNFMQWEVFLGTSKEKKVMSASETDRFVRLFGSPDDRQSAAGDPGPFITSSHSWELR